MDAPGVPKHALKFLRWICPEDLLEEIEGDLIQRFHREEKRYGIRTARRRFVFHVVRYVRPGIILRNHFSINLSEIAMLTNYFKVALRVIFRSKTFSAINISGLAMGITGALLLSLWIGKEFSYDRFHVNGDRIYEAWNRASENGEVNCWSVTPRVLAPTLKESFAGVEDAVSYAAWGSKQLLTAGNTRLLKSTGVFTDPGFLTMFSFPLLKGNPSRALAEPSSIVLTESLARQLFGDREAYGETITVGESGERFEFKITGILQDLPDNTGFRFEYLLPLSFLERVYGKDSYWGNNSVNTFVLLKEGTDITAVNKLVAPVVKDHFPEAKHIEIFLYPLGKLRLYSQFDNGVATGGRIDIIRMLMILGVCLVAIACINFVNLSTARAQRRAKEVAVRKVTGAIRRSLVLQFLCESLLVALSAGSIAIFIAYLLQPAFGTLVQQTLSLREAGPVFWTGVFSAILLVGLFAGGYPALYLSSFQPVRILKGTSVLSGRSRMRTLLVVFQFGFAITMVVSAVVIYRQIDYVQNREAGYNKDHLVYQHLTGDLVKNFSAYKRELLQSGIATSVTRSGAPITDRWSNTTEIRWRGWDPQKKVLIERIYMDERLAATAGLTITAGRDMDLERFPSDSTAVVLNETAVRAMGFSDPIGEIINDNGRDWHVVGVVKDFILTSPYHSVEPMVLLGAKGNGGELNVVHLRLNPAIPVSENIDRLSKLARKYNPDYPFEYYFADVEYQRKFANLEATLRITTLFTSIAIFIACLGLFGLSTYMTEARTREIGIRKVMGGSVAGITRLLTIAVLKPIFIAIVLFSPIAWLSMNWFLQTFPYRISPGIGIFLVAALVVLAISLMTIGVQTIRAARANPVKSLRNE